LPGSSGGQDLVPEQVWNVDLERAARVLAALVTVF
jgi:hypothetical protein